MSKQSVQIEITRRANRLPDAGNKYAVKPFIYQLTSNLNMSQFIAEEDNTCEECGKAIFGRSDKRFCNDSCRNAFNRKKREALRMPDHEHMNEVFRRIRENYQILSRYAVKEMKPREVLEISTDELMEQGFYFNHCTYIDTTSMLEVWRFCFDIGYRPIPGATAICFDPQYSNFDPK